MKLPIYSSLKTKLESKGLDSITSGQIAWFVASGFIALFCALCSTLYFYRDLFDYFIHSPMYFLFFISILLFFTAIFWLIFLGFYKNFFFIHLFWYCFMYLFSTIISGKLYPFLIASNILLIILWSFTKIPFKIKILFLIIYFCLEFVILIGFIPFALFYGGVSK